MAKKPGFIPGPPSKNGFGSMVKRIKDRIFGAGKKALAFLKRRKAPRSGNAFLGTGKQVALKASGPAPQKQPGLLAVLGKRIAGLFGKAPQPKSSEAFVFAVDDKPHSLQKRRMKRIALYTGGGLAAAAVVLAVILLTRGQPVSTAPSATEDVAAAAAVAQAANLPETTPLQTDQPEATPTPQTSAETAPPVETTPPDEMETAGAVPTDAAPVATTAPDVTTTPIDINDLVDYFMVEAELYYNKVGYSSNYYEYTEEEWYVLAQVIDGEAGSQSWEGKVAVGNVVMNRVLASGYPGSNIITVVTTRGQFSAYSEKNVPNSASKRAARAVLDDQLWTIPQHSFNFNSHKPKGEDWGIHAYWKKIGNHNFYVDQNKYRGRCRKLSVPPALFERTYKWPRYGCKPAARVKRVQLMLRSLGYSVDADSYFGMDTVKALKKFQSDKGLSTDGVAGPTTIKALIKAYGMADYYRDFCT